ncbi:C-signal-like isoform X2 [Haemorhous mexicanus]|uniref:C-signal-like isoform X2 n=1 Tax=Haemorhous mexicanus TaxID=30427 RepID=UPI0028BEFD28|nr:C-signal-like isoform X2 [Haemorhous mexicanus]
MAELCVSSVLVTGANRGLGLGFVQHFLRMPKPPQWIFATCRDPKGQRAQDLQNLVPKHPNLVIIALEIADPASIKAAAAKVEEHLGGSGLNLLINNAGMVKSKMLEEETLDDMTETYTINTVGPLLMGQAALNMLSKCQSVAYKEHGILCIALHPGWVQTDLGRSGGEAPPVTVDDSVQGMLKVLSSLSEKDTGAFLDWEGNVIPW